MLLLKSGKSGPSSGSRNCRVETVFVRISLSISRCNFSPIRNAANVIAYF